jgi:hypothetical protein
MWGSGILWTHWELGIKICSKRNLGITQNKFIQADEWF